MFPILAIFAWKKKEIEELKQEVRDLLFYFEAQSKLSNCEGVTSAELHDSQIIIQEDTASGGTDKASRRRKKKWNFICDFLLNLLFSFLFRIFL